MSRALLLLFVAILVIIIGFVGIFFMTRSSINNMNQSYETQGVKITITKEGSGRSATVNDRILAHYNGYLGEGTSGQKFDSSYDKNAPFLLILGQNKVIRGWELGLLGMKVGEKRTLVIPPELGYGVDGYPPIIPQNSTLTFEVEMLEIQ